MSVLRFGMVVVTIVVCVSAAASAMSLEEAMDRLKGYRFGQEDEAINTIRDTAVSSFNDPTTRQMLLAGLTAILESDATNDAKHFVCRQLALIGTEQQVPALARLLADPGLSQMARYALARIPGEAVDRALIEALGQTEGANKLGIINTLGNRRSVAAVEPLARLLDSGERDVAAEAARALGRIGTPAAANVLEELLGAGRGLAGEAVVDAYLNCADLLLADGKRNLAGSMYERILSPHLPAYAQGAALKGCTQALPAEKTAAHVLSALKNNDEQLQTVAAQAARDIPGPEASKVLADALPDSTTRAQTLLIHALGDRGDNAALAAVTKACDREDPDVRLAALEVLGVVGNSASISTLLRAATQGADMEKAVARASLANLQAPGVDDALIRRLSEAPDAEKVEIIEALIERGVTEGVPVLLGTARSEDEFVRFASGGALATLAQARDIPELVDLLVGAEPLDRVSFRLMVTKVARRHGAEGPAARELMKKGTQEMSVEVRCMFLQTLGELGDDAGLPALREALGDQNDEVKRTAIRALSRWPNPAPMPDLLRIADGGGSPAQQVLALRGYVDLVRRVKSLTPDEKLRAYKTALQLAPSDTERIVILARLPELKTFEAMRHVAEIPDAPLRNEAALAAVKIAKEIYASNAGEVKALLESIVAKDIRSDIRNEAQKILDQIATMGSYLVDWEVAGPYLEKGKNYAQLFDTPFDPERPKAKVQWRKMPVSANGQHPAYLDLLKELDGGEQRVAYVRTQIESTDVKPVTLEIFSDDGVKVWLNGQVVHSNNVARPIMPEPDRVTVTLQKGVNRLMLKVTQNNQPWGAIVRVREARTAEAKLGEGFKLHVINADSRFEAAGVLDVNRDGRLDIFCGGFWYEAPDWKPHFVREVQEEGNYYYDFANLPVDVDGDGWTDIVNAAWHNKMVFWERNPGKAGGPWEVFEIDTPGNMETAMAFDINGDGRTDILPNIMSQAAWYEFHREASAPQGVRWEKHQLPKEAAGHGLGAGDVNKDGRCDVVTPKGWLEQTVDGWQWHPEFELGHASIPILVHDVDADGDSDIIWGLGHNYGLFWLEQTAANGQREWQKHAIDDSWSQPHYMLMADLDGDGEAELVTGKRHYAHNGKDPGGNDPLCVYCYDFDAAAKKWTRRTMHEGGRVGLGINTAAVDMDGDGDIDVVAPGKSGLYLFENLLK